jgi:hypothetical protein
VNHSGIRILAKALQAAIPGTLPALGGKEDFSVFVGHIPDAPTNAVGVLGSTPVLQGRNHKTGETVEHPGYRVLVRSKTYPSGDTVANAVNNALDTLLRTTVELEDDTYVIQAVHKTTGLIPIGRDPDNGHENWSITGYFSLQDE